MRLAFFIGVVLLAGCKRDSGSTGSTPTTTGVVVARPKGDRPVLVAPLVGGIPDSWTHKELLERLRSKGLKYDMHKTDWHAFFGPAVLLVKVPNMIEDGTAAERAFQKKDWDVVYCQLRRTAQEARDQVGNRGERATSIGRFVFEGDPDELEKLHKALD